MICFPVVNSRFVSASWPLWIGSCRYFNFLLKLQHMPKFMTYISEVLIIAKFINSSWAVMSIYIINCLKIYMRWEDDHTKDWKFYNWKENTLNFLGFSKHKLQTNKNKTLPVHHRTFCMSLRFLFWFLTLPLSCFDRVAQMSLRRGMCWWSLLGLLVDKCCHLVNCRQVWHKLSYFLEASELLKTCKWYWIVYCSFNQIPNFNRRFQAEIINPIDRVLSKSKADPCYVL